MSSAAADPATAARARRTAAVQPVPAAGGAEPMPVAAEAAAAAVARPRIHPLLVVMHWTVALLVALAVATATLRWMLPPGDALRPLLRRAHVVVGVFVFLFALARVVVRWRHPPAPLADRPAVARAGAAAVHLALYGVILAQPLLGLLSMQAGDKPVTLFGFALPTLLAPDPELHFALKDAHAVLAVLLYGAVLLHVCAALWHHAVRRDRTLLDMLGRTPPSPEPRRPS